MTVHSSFWITSTREPGYDQLEEQLATTVLVVGGGITGLTTALLLKRAGVPVVVLEGATVGSGVTGHTTGKVTAGQSLAYSHLEEVHGLETSRAYAQSQLAALDLVFRLAADLDIDCDLRHATDWVFAENEQEVALLEAELRASERAGLGRLLRRTVAAPVPARAALGLPQQAELHARKYILGLAAAVDGDGSRVFEHSRVLELETEGALVGRTERGGVTAEHVVLATNAPIGPDSRFSSRVHAWRAYAVAARVPKGSVQDMWINVGSSTRSLRSAPLEEGSAELLIAVGEGHRVGQEADTEARYRALSLFVQEHFGVTPEYAWSTQDQYSVDGLPFIGRVSGEERPVYVATGFGGWGLTNGSLAGLLLRDAIIEHENAWSPVFDANRSPLIQAPGSFLRANSEVAWQMLYGRVKRRERDVEGVPHGTGTVIRTDDGQVAVYREEDGGIHAVSAACTHMGCVVGWNEAERTWDCPCHGSRFAIDGEVIEGPATRPLEPVDVEESARTA
jgi:glycine/D-amino acid oxidase-like deaminating enzyme/nitrite reductase/ring-hydroxylating ferredoxin subunit